MNENKRATIGKVFMIIFITLGVLLAVGLTLWVTLGLVKDSKNKDNIESHLPGQNNPTQILKRNANINDIEFDCNLNISALGVDIIIRPQVDIDNLTVVYKAYDKNNRLITEITKKLGNVKKGVEQSFTISLVDIGLTNFLKIENQSMSITSGTVSYFK